jgi:hypothetical protein
MKRYLLLSLIFMCFAFQSPTNNLETQNVIKTVFELAKVGYDNLDAKSLVKAAKILIENPEVQQIKSKLEINEYKPSKDESILEQYNFFNPIELLANAKKIAPFDAKILRWRIEQLEKKLPDYNEMSLNFNDIKVKNYLIYGNNSKTIALKFNKNKQVNLSVRIGNDLKLYVLDATLDKSVGKSNFIGDTRLVSFVSESEGSYKITIENTAEKANDCYLMVETK